MNGEAVRDDFHGLQLDGLSWSRPPGPESSMIVPTLSVMKPGRVDLVERHAEDARQPPRGRRLARPGHRHDEHPLHAVIVFERAIGSPVCR
jgi:hypothetical protein